MDKPTVAKQWTIDIFETVKKLKDHPKLGRTLNELNVEEYRELIFGNYRIIYSLGVDSINILTVRSFKQLLSIEDLE